MAGARDHLDQHDGHASPTAARRSPERAPGPTIAGHDDPRLAHGGGAGSDLLHLQRTAGNAAVSALVAPVVQRVVEIDEVTSEAAGAGAAPDAGFGAAPGAGPGATMGAPVSSDGGATTISGSSINLAAPVTSSEGLIRASVIQADTVIAENYTPGAGNLF
jgi:hypothetical protein